MGGSYRIVASAGRPAGQLSATELFRVSMALTNAFSSAVGAPSLRGVAGFPVTRQIES